MLHTINSTCFEQVTTTTLTRTRRDNAAGTATVTDTTSRTRNVTDLCYELSGDATVGVSRLLGVMVGFETAEDPDRVHVHLELGPPMPDPYDRELHSRIALTFNRDGDGHFQLTQQHAKLPSEVKAAAEVFLQRALTDLTTNLASNR